MAGNFCYCIIELVLAAVTHRNKRASGDLQRPGFVAGTRTSINLQLSLSDEKCPFWRSSHHTANQTSQVLPFSVRFSWGSTCVDIRQKAALLAMWNCRQIPLESIPASRHRPRFGQSVWISSPDRLLKSDRQQESEAECDEYSSVCRRESQTSREGELTFCDNGHILNR